MASLLRQSLPRQKLPQELLAVCAVTLSSRKFSVLNRPLPKYDGHVPLTVPERIGLAVGSAVTSLFNPRRAGMIGTSLPIVTC
jgi:ubiquinone biosynthesis protein COQ4